MTFDIIVIGGGAAGLLAAISAAEENKKVLLIEKNSSLGVKLKLTGKGRCNITNKSDKKQFINAFGKNGRFLHRAFSRFFNNDIIALLEENDTPCVTENNGRVYPKSNQASDVVNALKTYLKKLNVTVLKNTLVTKVLVNKQIVEGLITKQLKDKTEKPFSARKVIIATGGLSYPKTGSTGDGYKFAKRLGHTVITPKASLVALETSKNTISLEGLSLKDVKLTLYNNNKKVDEVLGDIVFTNNGISGPAIFKLNRAYNSIDSGTSNILIDLKPYISIQNFINKLNLKFNKNGAMKLKNLLKHILSKKLISLCLETIKVDPDKFVNQINKKEKTAIVSWIKGIIFTISKTAPIEEAAVTAGGVNVKEIDPYTMESKIIKNLYFAGELIDIDGDTGGYNLQAAFSTGYLAGKSASINNTKNNTNL